MNDPLALEIADRYASAEAAFEGCRCGTVPNSLAGGRPAVTAGETGTDQGLARDQAAVFQPPKALSQVSWRTSTARFRA
jgi:hypothetical protein